MCGFAGIYCFEKGDTFDETTFMLMTQSLTHRGPDSEGYLFAGNFNKNKLLNFNCSFLKYPNSFFLGHRRLSIIDLDEKASQPMCNKDKTIWVAFNGEIYNHIELRNELLKYGYKFLTDHSDTEVLVYGYEKWGINFIQKLNGMFAIVLWDTINNFLFLIRDRIGIKPLYYTFFEKKIIFASEIKAILAYNKIERKLNPNALYDYLSFLCVPSPNTMFKGIYKLPAGSYIKIDGNEKKTEFKSYWDLFDNIEDYSHENEKIIAENLFYNLEKSVNYRMQSDVEAGVFLSGGIDSSAIAVLFHKNRNKNKKIKTVVTGFPEDNNEFQFAEQIANIIEAEHFSKLIYYDEVEQFLKRMAYIQDEPIGDPVCIPVYFISKIARENGIVVSLVGEGSDELFSGYPAWKVYLDLQNSLDKNGFNNFLKLFEKFFPYKEAKYFEIIKRAKIGQRIFWNGAETFVESEKRNILTRELLMSLDNYSSYEIIENYYYKFISSGRDSNLDWMTYIDFKIRLPELLLMRIDKMSMANSLEVRVPFLDHEFVEFSLGIPENIKIKNNILKYILKVALKDILPNNIIHRKKQGFSAPTSLWFKNRLKYFFKEIFINFNNEHKWFSETFLKVFEIDYKIHKAWYILNVILWANEFKVVL